MSNPRWSLIGLLVLQAIALILYPPAYFQSAPQAAVLPPAMFILLLLSLVGMNSGVLNPLLGRTSLTFVQGINIVVRLMMFFPHITTNSGGLDWLFILAQLIGMGLSWFTIIQMEKRPLGSLVLINRA